MFAPKGGYCVYCSSNILRNTHSIKIWGIFNNCYIATTLDRIKREIEAPLSPIQWCTRATTKTRHFFHHWNGGRGGLNFSSILFKIVRNCSTWQDKGVNINVTNVWLHSSVGRASHRYRGGHGFESRWSLDFFRLLLSNCLNWKIYCNDHSSLWSTTAVQIYELFHIYFTSLLTNC